VTRTISARRSLAIALGAVAIMTACTGATEPDGMSPSGSPEPAVRLASTGGDVFAWEQRIDGIGDCSSVVALVGGAEVDAEVQVGDGVFSIVAPVGSGEQELTARCMLADGTVAETEPIVLAGMLESRPTARIALRIDGEAVVLDGSRSLPAEPDGAAVERFTWEPHVAVGQTVREAALRLGNGAAFDHPAHGEYLALSVPAEDGEYFVSLTVRDEAGRTDTSTTYFAVTGGRPRSVDLMIEHPSWIDDSIVYAPVHKLWGGGAKSIERRLPYLKQLGVDALWLWPPVTTRALGEQYAIVDYFTLDEEWGTPEEFRSLVDRAHEL
jgi:hypothetical protein